MSTDLSSSAKDIEAINVSEHVHIERVSDQRAFSGALRLMADYGIMAGPTSGAVFQSMCDYIDHISETTSISPKTILLILTDSALHYTSLLMSKPHLLASGLMDEQRTKETIHNLVNRCFGAAVEDLQTPEVISVKQDWPISIAMEFMHPLFNLIC